MKRKTEIIFYRALLLKKIIKDMENIVDDCYEDFVGGTPVSRNVHLERFMELFRLMRLLNETGTLKKTHKEIPYALC